MCKLAWPRRGTKGELRQHQAGPTVTHKGPDKAPLLLSQHRPPRLAGWRRPVGAGGRCRRDPAAGPENLEGYKAHMLGRCFIGGGFCSVVGLAHGIRGACRCCIVSGPCSNSALATWFGQQGRKCVLPGSWFAIARLARQPIIVHSTYLLSSHSRLLNRYSIRRGATLLRVGPKLVAKFFTLVSELVACSSNRKLSIQTTPQTYGMAAKAQCWPGPGNPLTVASFSSSSPSLLSGRHSRTRR